MLFSPYKLQKINNLNLQFIMSKDDLNFVLPGEKNIPPRKS